MKQAKSTEDQKRKPAVSSEDVFHVFGVEGVDLDKVWSRIPVLIEEDGFSGTLLISSSDVEEGILNHEELAVRGLSAQGVQFWLFDDGFVHIQLPWLASPGDVRLVFWVIRAMQEMYPELEVYLNDDSKNPIVVGPENIKAMMLCRLQNMIALLEQGFEEGGFIGIQGLRHQLVFPPVDPDCPDEELQKALYQIFEDFVAVQWRWEDYTDAGLARTTAPDGEEFTLRMLSNDMDTFVGVCQKLSLATSDMSSINLVDARLFMEKMEDNPYYERVDACQFVLKKMPDAEWDAICKSMGGQEIQRRTNTFILKWNPAISSFKYEDYREAYAQYPEGFQMNWSVYEWQKAKKGDEFYMIRVGAGQTGAVWHGVFTSDPYQSDDWSGRGRKVYYMDMDVYEMNEPDSEAIIPTEKLQEVIPDLEWNKGHSGQLLTVRQAEILDRLWRERFFDID